MTLKYEFNQTVLAMRQAVLVAGSQEGLKWWSGDPLSPTSNTVLTTLLPGTGALAGLMVLERSVRRIGAEQRTEGITLFDLTEPHEVVLRQQPHMHQEFDLPAFKSGAELGAWLANAFNLPDVEAGKWVSNEQHRHVICPDPWTHQSDGVANLKKLALLVSALRFSKPGLFLQPVLVESEIDGEPA